MAELAPIELVTPIPGLQGGGLCCQRLGELSKGRIPSPGALLNRPKRLRMAALATPDARGPGDLSSLCHRAEARATRELAVPSLELVRHLATSSIRTLRNARSYTSSFLFLVRQQSFLPGPPWRTSVGAIIAIPKKKGALEDVFSLESVPVWTRMAAFPEGRTDRILVGTDPPKPPNLHQTTQTFSAHLGFINVAPRWSTPHQLIHATCGIVVGFVPPGPLVGLAREST